MRCVMIVLIYSCCLYYRIARLINLLNSFKDHLITWTCIHAYHTPLLHFLNTLRDKSSVSMGNSLRVIIDLSDLLELNDTEGSRRVDSMRSGLSLSKVLSESSQVEIYFPQYKTNYFCISIDSFSGAVFTFGCVYLSIVPSTPSGGRKSPSVQIPEV